MNLSKLKKILLRLYKSYVIKHLPRILLALVLSFGVAAGTAAIAWLLDPAVKKIFIEQDKTMICDCNCIHYQRFVFVFC